MGALEDAIGGAMRSMSLADTTPAELERRARQYTLQDWKSQFTQKVMGVGALTGIVGGPVGLALEGADLAYLFAAGGKACFGIGYIHGRAVDTEHDLNVILAIWAGAAETAGYIPAGKIGIKLGGKVAAGAVANVAGKVVAKALFKTNVKVASKVISKVGSKMAAKLATKAGMKWIPLIGGAVSAGINYWVIDGLMGAAEQFYTADYVVLSDELASEL